MEDDVPRVMSLVYHFFPPGDIEEEFLTGSPVEAVEADQVSFKRTYTDFVLVGFLV